jgi:hypothetical protein
MFRFSSLLFLLLLSRSYATELSIKYDDKVDATYYQVGEYMNYYLSDGEQKLYIGTYRQAPILHKFDFVSLIESGDKSNELYLVTTADGKIQLTDLISQVYELYPQSKYFTLFVEDVLQEPNGKISIKLYSPTEDKELVVRLDRNFKLLLPEI